MDRFFEFEKAKLFDTWKRARNNKYSNPKFDAFHNFFKAFYERIKNEDIASLTETQKICLKKAMSYFQERVNCLSNNTATNAPYEVVESIKLAARTWVPNIDDYIILTRYGNYSFYVDQRMEEEVLTYIANDYNISFHKKTVLLSIPQHYYRDYLNNVVLYHEIGHFVDSVNNISFATCYKTISDIQNGLNIDKIYQEFPFIRGLSINNIIDISSLQLKEIGWYLYRHWGEYFADIFAASFIGKNIERYLRYGEFPDSESDVFSQTHPSNKHRYKMIDAFLSSKNNYVVDTIQDMLVRKSLPKIHKISSTINTDDLYHLLPIELNDDQDVHALYSLAWEVWDGDRNRFKRENNMSFDLQPTQLYTVLNNLVEKSISNYLIKTKWENVSK